VALSKICKSAILFFPGPCLNQLIAVQYEVLTHLLANPAVVCQECRSK